jgi:two-component system response regulator PilR (NtrC family)
MAENNIIQAQDLPEILATFVPSLPPSSQDADLSPDNQLSPNKTISLENFSLEKHLEVIEKGLMEQALEETRWNKTAAAKKLGMSFRSFRYRIKKLGLD